MGEYKINILPFNVLYKQVEVAFSQEEKMGYNKIFKNNLPKNYPPDILLKVDEHVWWSMAPQVGDTTISVNLFENKRFAKHYFNKLLFEHFNGQNILTNRNFINDTEVYLEDGLTHNTEYKKYNRFTLRIDDNVLIEGTSLIVSYDGDKFILNKSIGEALLTDSYLGKVKYKERVTKYKLLSDIEQADKTNIYPFLNRDIKLALSLPHIKNNSDNKYKKYYDLIDRFYGLHLKDKLIGNNIKIVESGFYRPHISNINHTTEDSNLLLFGNNQKHFTPYVGLKEYGPTQALQSEAVRFIFIFHKDDKELANKTYSYLKKGYKSFPGMESFVKIKFEIDAKRSIQFSATNPIAEITTAIETLQSKPDTQFDPNVTYAAIYISRIKKDSDGDETDEVYYRLKELLLRYKISSQVIFSNNINNPSFNYFLPNIAIALLAKLGGIPWRLYRPVKNDLVIGIGADRSRVENNKYIGNAFCFQNDGRFVGFNAYEKNDTDSLAKALKEAIQQYIVDNKSVERLVIHYYKIMSREEEKPIREVLDHLNFSLPYVVVTINDTLSKGYVLFDVAFDGKMPQSGTFIKTKWNEYLLCNNTRYSTNTGSKLEGFPLPIKIKLMSYNYEKINDINVVRELIDQVYQFSRMYWKSVRQRNMPVTIEYSELVAKMISHFDNKDLVPYARNTLWFL